jgi:hypothetical protein
MRGLKNTNSSPAGSPIWLGRLTLAAILALVTLPLADQAHCQDDVSGIAVAKPDSGSPPRPTDAASSSKPVGSQATASESAVGASDASDDSSTDDSIISEVATETDLPLLETSPASAGGSRPEEAANSVRELSVEPGTLPLLPADRPAWIGAPADFSQSVHRLYVGSQVTDSQQDIDLLLEVPLVVAVGDYIDRQLIGIDGAALDLRQQVDADYIRKNLIDDPDGFLAKLNAGGAPMYQKWVTVSITPAQREQIQQWYREAVQRKRLAPVGLGLLGVIGFVGISHLALRRRHGMPKSQPVVQHPFVDKEPVANPNVVRRSRGGLPVLLVLGCVLLFPALIGFSLLLWTGKRHSVLRTHEHSVHVNPHIPGMPEMPRMPDMPRMVVTPGVPDGEQVLHQSDSQVIYRSGGQQIIIRKSPK